MSDDLVKGAEYMFGKLMPIAEAQLDEIEALRADLAVAVKALEKQPQIVYETLLEATAWMGIPEKNREKYIKERVENVKFIINEALAQIQNSQGPKKED